MKDSNPNMLTDILTGLDRVDKDMVKMVSQLGNRIHRRTTSGRDVSMRSFVPYTPLTKLSREADNRPTGHVFLAYKGGMLNSMTAKRRDSRTVALFFSSQDDNDKAVWQHFGTNPYTIKPKVKKGLANKKAGLYFGKEVHHPGLPSRKFFGLSNSDRAYMKLSVSKLLRK